MHWLESLKQIRALKLSLARIDPRGGMPIVPPPGASEAAIAGVERRIGVALPPSYRALLAHHDGWPQLFAGASLLGVRALTRGTFVDVARMVMEECSPIEVREDDVVAPCDGAGGVEASSLVPSRIVPFGIDAEAETIFAWDVGRARSDGELDVILWTNDICVRLASFPDLVDFILEMLSSELEERRRQAAASIALTPRPQAVSAPRRARAGAPIESAPRSAAGSLAIG